MSSIADFTKIIYQLLPSIKQSATIMLLASIFYEAIKFIPVYLLKLIVDEIFLEPSLSYLLWLVAGVFVSLMALLYIEVKMVTWVAVTSAQQQEEVMTKSFKKVTKLPLGWHEDQNTGSLVSKITKASNYVGGLLWFLNNDVIPSSTQIVLTAAVLSWVDWRIGLIYIVFTPIMIWMIDYQFKEVQPVRQTYHEAYEDATKELAQTLYNIQTVQNYAQETREQETQKTALNRFVQGVKQRASYEYKAIFTRDTLTNLVRAATLGLAVYLVFEGSITAGDLVLVFTLTEKAYMNLFRLGRIYSFMGDTHEALERALKIQQEETTLEDTGEEAFSNGDIEFKRVSFCYDDEQVLKEITLSIPANTTAALVGPSGSGKTTLVRLLMRHYDPQQGTISIAKNSLPTLRLADLRRNIAFVSQHTELFDRSIHENIAYTKKTRREAVIQAAKQANAHEFIQQLPNGYDTIIGEQGVKLSGGQRQRLSIARALLSDAPIIVFDEATSSLDSESEQAIQDALVKITNKTLLIIAHRLSTIEHADQIIVLREGHVAEQGSHEDLSSKDGLYARMRELQQLGELRD